MASEAQLQLRSKVRQLKKQQEEQRKELDASFKELAKDFQSGALIRNSISGFLEDKRLQRDLFQSVVPVFTSFISNTIMKKSKGTRVKILTVLSELGINGLTNSNYGKHLKNYSKAFIEVIKDSTKTKK